MNNSNRPQTVKDLLQWAVFFLGKDKRIDAELLLAKVCNCTRAKLWTYPEEIVEPQKVNLFCKLLAERKDGEPLQYLLGKQNFMGMDLLVNSSVLIPRSDTEVLVEEVIKIAQNIIRPVKILDLCTGSGAIAISIAKNVSWAKVTAVDISSEALKVAKSNADVNGVANQVVFQEGDLFTPVEKEKFNLIVSNPPYISTEEMADLPADVQREPRLALWGGDDGLAFYRRITKQVQGYLHKPGYLLVEIGWQQGQEVLNLFRKAGLTDCQIIKDWAGKDRVVKGKWHEK